MIELAGVSKTYKAKTGNVPALKNVNIRIDDGKIYGIIGLSGAGKSTLVRCINLLETPTEGKVFIDGENVLEFSRKKLLATRRNIGMIFQNFNLLEQRTVFDNVKFPLEIAGVNRKDAEKRVRELLEIVSLADREKAYPSELSGGQKQRVAIARALATGPKYLLCDEATSALDPRTTSSILSLLRDINRRFGVTIVIITHEMRVVESVCTDVAILSDGEVVESGRVDDVFSDPAAKISEELILPSLMRILGENRSGRNVRVLLKGESLEASVTALIALNLRVCVRVLYSDERMRHGKSYGQVLLSAPTEADAERIKDYLKTLRLTVKEDACV